MDKAQRLPRSPWGPRRVLEFELGPSWDAWWQDSNKYLSDQMTGIVQSEDLPGTFYLLKDIEPRRILVDLPNAIQVEAEEGAGHNFVDDLMANQDHGFSRVPASHLVQQSQESGLDIGQAFARRESDLRRCGAPGGIELRVALLGFRVGQTLKLPVIDVEQALMGFNRKGPLGRQGLDGLLGTL